MGHSVHGPDRHALLCAWPLCCCALLQDMLKSFASSEYATQFHQAYYLQLLREVLAVMTDTFHTPGFKLHCKILLHLFGLVRDGTTTIIKAPLWDVAVGDRQAGSPAL